MMEFSYHIFLDGQQQGPFEIEQLRQLEISAETMVWAEGFSDWTRAEDVKELNTLFIKSFPPPFNNNKSATPPPNQREIKEKQSSESINKSFLEKNRLIISICILIIGGLILFNLNSDNGDELNNEEISNEEINKINHEPQPTNNDYPKENVDVPVNTDQISPTQQNNTPKKRQLTEAEIRENLFSKEVSNPSNYLSASGTYRVNLASNTIVTGTISNNAAIAGFKNIKISAKFYSKTDLLLGKESFIVMDFIDPNNSTDFTYKIYGWWSDIDHWTLDVVTAEGY